MYIPELYKNENPQEIEQFLHQNGFAILVNQTQGKLWATHTPLLLETLEEGKLSLCGHISKENPQAQDFQTNEEVLAIFQGPHTYISSSWYDHENVPTWNYIAVHVYGTLELLDHEQSVSSLKRLVDKYEKTQEHPVRVENLSAKTMRQAHGIVAFRIHIKAIEAKKKLSQNRDDANYKNIMQQLDQSEDAHAKAIAREMKQNRRNL